MTQCGRHGSFSIWRWCRSGTASRLLAWLILAITIVGAFIGALSPNWANVKELLQLLLPAETALLAFAAGFYFGTRRD